MLGKPSQTNWAKNQLYDLEQGISFRMSEGYDPNNRLSIARRRGAGVEILKIKPEAPDEPPPFPQLSHFIATCFS